LTFFGLHRHTTPAACSSVHRTGWHTLPPRARVRWLLLQGGTDYARVTPTPLDTERVATHDSVIVVFTCPVAVVPLADGWNRTQDTDKTSCGHLPHVHIPTLAVRDTPRRLDAVLPAGLLTCLLLVRRLRHWYGFLFVSPQRAQLPTFADQLGERLVPTTPPFPLLHKLHGPPRFWLTDRLHLPPPAFGRCDGERQDNTHVSFGRTRLPPAAAPSNAGRRCGRRGEHTAGPHPTVRSYPVVVISALHHSSPTFPRHPWLDDTDVPR